MGGPRWLGTVKHHNMQYNVALQHAQQIVSFGQILDTWTLFGGGYRTMLETKYLKMHARLTVVVPPDVVHGRAWGAWLY